MKTAQKNPSRERGIFCNRTLNLRSIRAIGYDMDYTLVHYRVEEWELRAYEHLKSHFLSMGWPVSGLSFDPEMIRRGLIIDQETGNIVKANRFGFIKRACHGTRILDFEAQREAYARTIVDLSEGRWVFLNTLFSLSEGCMYAQLVDMLDQKLLPEPMGYADLYRRVRKGIDEAHMEGKLKAEIVAHPEKYVVLDPEIGLALLDQHHSGKKLMLITNSEWNYAGAMMSYCFDRYLPEGMGWKDLFDLIIVGARKPEFFTTEPPFFEVVTPEGLLSPVSGALQPKAAYLGGSAHAVERYLGVSGDEILYVGDHMFGDVRVTKNVLRWRTALILREIEEEIRANEEFRSREIELAGLMEEKENLEAQACNLRLMLQRKRESYAGPVSETDEKLHADLARFRMELERLDSAIAPLAKQASELGSPLWGPLMRAGNDKSHLAFQIERYADIYTSRVSNFLQATPYVYLRSPRGSLPHDPSLPASPHAR